MEKLELNKINLETNQCVEINSESDFEKIYSFTRPFKNGLSFEDYIYQYGYPYFPSYVYWSESVFKWVSLGLNSDPINLFTKQKLQIININQAIK